MAATDFNPTTTKGVFVPIISLIKSVASTKFVGAAIVNYLNDRQLNNIQDTLHKHEEQIEILQKIVGQELCVNKATYLEDLISALQKAKDEANEEKRKLYATFLTACCHPDNLKKENKRIFLEILENIDFNGVLILKELTPYYNGRNTLEHFISVFDNKCSKNDIMIQLDYLASRNLIIQCSQGDIDKLYVGIGHRKRPIAAEGLFYKRTVLGDSFYQFLIKGLT